MGYYFNKILETGFDEAVERVKNGLKKEGFGVLTTIDVKDTLAKKLNVNFQKYMILGACNPSFAHQALLKENKIGTMLPCNVIIQEISPNKIEAAAIDPISSMAAVKNQDLMGIASQVRSKLERVIADL